MLEPVMLEGIVVKRLKRFSDERGFFTETMRTDWKDLFQDDTVAQANLSITYPNIIRAWHKHLKGQTDYFIALKGNIKICVYDEKTEERKNRRTKRNSFNKPRPANSKSTRTLLARLQSARQ
jgi:dTDP-4-dehydrorhamnose 3,5-epimerase-like enzyme